MKHLLLKSFLVLTMIIGLSSMAAASEVIGTLSSSGNQNAQQNTNTGAPSANEEKPVPSDNGSIAGNVSGGTSKTSSEGSGTRGSNGAVLGDSTMAAGQRSNTSSQTTGSLYQYEPSPSAQAATYGTGVSESTTANDDSSAQVLGTSSQEAAVFGTFSEFSASSWFWIIVLGLLLIAVLTYIYTNNKEQTRRTRLYY